MNIWLSFPYESFYSTTDAFNFIAGFIRFHKEGILSSKEGSDYTNYDQYEIAEYLNSNNLDTFTLFSNYSKYFEFRNSVTFRRNQLTHLNIFCISIESISGLSFDELLLASSKKGFTMGILYNLSKSHWQNEKDVINYKTFNKPYEHLSKIWDESISPTLGEVIDISKNPGHTMETYGTVLMAAPEMWFGTGCWQYFDKRTVLSFQGAIEIKEVLPHVVYVKLFDWEVPDYESPEILSLQKRFREWTRMDEIEQELNKMVAKHTQSASLEINLRDPSNPKEKLNILEIISQKKKK